MILAFSWFVMEQTGSDAEIARWITPQDHASAEGPRRQSSLAARAVLRFLLTQQTGRGDWPIIKDAQGKPRIKGAPNLSISWSHGGGLAAAALILAERPLGIDVEPHKPRDVQALAAHAFGPREQAWVRQGGHPAFYRLWSLREAMGKASGQGLSFAADGLDHVPDGPMDGSWYGEGWQLSHLSPRPGYSLALAVGGDAPVHLLSARNCSMNGATGQLCG